MELNKLDIQYLAGMGPKRAELLATELGIRSVDALIHYFPYRYVDRSRFYKISEIEGTSAHIQVRGQIVGFREAGEGRSHRLIASFSDGSSTIDLIFFKGLKYITDSYKLYTDYIVFGKPNCFNGVYSFVHPDIEQPSATNQTGFMPLYHTTEKMKNKFLHSKALQKLIYSGLRMLPTDLPETLPKFLLEQYHLMPLRQALINIHFPQRNDLLEAARYRLKIEELFYIQLAILRQAKGYKQRSSGHPFTTIGSCFNDFYHHHLPFQLTEAQKRVVREIYNDVRGTVQMNRLVQGDVGSGKTIVALLCMLMAVDNGYQACLVAPTEILATQHFESLSQLLKDMPVEVRLLTGSTKKKDRVPLHEGLRSGAVQILIGTHAVFEDEVQFARLGLVVIDEQHRFGVAQRARLWAKNPQPPHVLVMTATPIPRTLAMTLYGDLDVSVIDQLPPGRKPIRTVHVYEERQGAMYAFLRDQMKAGRQVYVVYPLIEESEKIDLKNLTEGYEYLCKEFSHFSLGMLHGKMKAAEKEAVMQDFASGKHQMLVATTVIEVGVNVPNATVMVIQNAERFGLAQLHQLRGRVGRGGDQSYCILVTRYELTQDTRKRMEIMTSTNDGFVIAEADLKLRGPGDLEGTMQSGLPFNLQLSDLTRDGEVLQLARNAAQQVLEADPLLQQPHNQYLRQQLRTRATDVVNWSMIS